MLLHLCPALPNGRIETMTIKLFAVESVGLASVRAKVTEFRVDRRGRNARKGKEKIIVNLATLSYFAIYWSGCGGTKRGQQTIHCRLLQRVRGCKLARLLKAKRREIDFSRTWAVWDGGRGNV
jgi:hypothetical protein